MGILDYALRRTLLKAHQQVWAWQDEWINLTIEDIRRLEREAQEELRQKYHANDDEQNQNNDTLDPPDYEKTALPSRSESHLPSVDESIESASDDEDAFVDAV